MSNNYIHIGTLNDHSQDHSKHVTINASGADISSLVRSFFAEDVTPVQEEKPTESVDSIIFTKKAKKEGKIDLIIDALRKSMQGRRDKSRALAQEVQIWQKDEYVDAHYNARVMYDELAKLIPLSFGYEVFKKYYNNTI